MSRNQRFVLLFHIMFQIGSDRSFSSKNKFLYIIYYALHIFNEFSFSSSSYLFFCFDIAFHYEKLLDISSYYCTSWKNSSTSNKSLRGIVVILFKKAYCSNHLQDEMSNLILSSKTGFLSLMKYLCKWEIWKNTCSVKIWFSLCMNSHYTWFIVIFANLV